MRVAEVGAALVVQRHPTDEVDDVALLRSDDVIGGVPAHTAADVADLSLAAARVDAAYEPIELRLQNSVVAERWEERLAGKKELQLAIHFDDGLRGLSGIGHLRLVVLLAVAVHGLVMRDVAAANDLALHDLVRLVLVLDEEVDGLALEERKQPLLRDRIVAIVLLEDLELPLAEGIAQNDAVSLDVRGGAGEGDAVLAGVQVQRKQLAHNGKVLVVDGERGAVVSRELGVFVFLSESGERKQKCSEQ